MIISKTTLAPGRLLCSVDMEKSYLMARQVTCCCTMGLAHLAKFPMDQKHKMSDHGLNTEAKVNPKITELPQVKQLPWVHVNGPSEDKKETYLHVCHINIPEARFKPVVDPDLVTKFLEPSQISMIE